MSIRVSPVKAGSVYAVTINGKQIIVFASHGCDAVKWAVNEFGELK